MLFGSNSAQVRTLLPHTVADPPATNSQGSALAKDTINMKRGTIKHIHMFTGKLKCTPCSHIALSGYRCVLDLCPVLCVGVESDEQSTHS